MFIVYNLVVMYLYELSFNNIISIKNNIISMFLKRAGGIFKLLNYLRLNENEKHI